RVATGQAFKHLNFLSIFLFLFFISLIISAIFAVNPYRAFWGDLERGEGLFGFLHFFAFLIMSIAIFEKKDWLNFFKISLGVGFIVIFYAFLQYFGAKNFPFLFISEERPISFIGNPAFLATHMFFVMIFAIVVFFGNSSKIFKPLNFETFKLLFWRYFSLLIIPLSAITIFLTATRGAILGLLVGVFALLIYFVFKSFKPLNFKTFKHLNFIPLSLLILIIIFSAFFWFTRDAAIWQKIPGLNRLAQTATMDKSDASTQFRLMTWKLSWEAFKEKPIFGWGQENYLTAYQKYYNPDYAIYGESWLDRAHNKIFDLLVMQGIFGLLAYLGIFASVIYVLFKKDGLMTKFIVAALIGYFVQNLFVMDQIVSDIMFFAVLGYAISFKSLNSEILKTLNFETLKLLNFKTIVLRLAGLILIIILGYSLYSYNYIPYIQAKTFGEAKKIDQASLIEEKLKQASQPYNFSQFNLRAHIVDYFYDNQPYVFQAEKYKPLFDSFIGLIDEAAGKEPYDIRMFIRKTQMSQSMAINYPELYKEAEESMRKAIELAPNRQELYYNLAFTLLGQKKFQEAVEVSQKAVELSPNVARAHYHLAFVLAVIGPQYADKIIYEMEFAEKLSPNFEGLRDNDHNIIALVYSRLGQLDKVAEIVKRSIDMRLPIRFLSDYYEEAIGYYIATRDTENLIETADYYGNYNQKAKEDMEILIDLVKKGNWEIIDNLSK
ncbi:MAG: O-antigen ligase family protein, partial [Patescibacteria group bacterium]|nr:O-antigen ligase family protein [Patescibacteria group bacterium]